MIELYVGDDMNNRGFTLVEMLATVVILGIVMGIATYGVIGVINSSKEKSEDVFVSKLENVIQTYISDNRFNWGNGANVGKFNKCRRVQDDGECYLDEAVLTNFYKVIINNNSSEDNMFPLSELADDKYMQGGKIINPKNKLDCLSNDKDIDVLLYKDDDSVYYYYADLSNLSCDISDDNKIITNISKNMCNVLKWDYTDKEVCVKNE